MFFLLHVHTIIIPNQEVPIDKTHRRAFMTISLRTK
jgi:hypothetical protein